MTRLLILIVLLGLLFIIYWYYDKILVEENTEPKMITPNLETTRRIKTNKKNKTNKINKSNKYKSNKNTFLSFIDPETEESDILPIDDQSYQTVISEDLSKSTNLTKTTKSDELSKSLKSDEFSLSDLEN